MANDSASGTRQADVMAAQVLVAEPGEPPANDPLLTADLRADDLVAGDLLVEEVSIDGMCGVY
jgi:mycofactocin precursor